jgi:hypothetical protein
MLLRYDKSDTHKGALVLPVPDMYSLLQVGSVLIGMDGDLTNELMAVFRDDMLTIETMSRREYFELEGYSFDEIPPENLDGDMEIVRFGSPGRIISDRLDVIGVDPISALTQLDGYLSSRSDNKGSLNASQFVEKLAACKEFFPFGDETDQSVGSDHWLQFTIPNLGELYALRIALLAFPDGEVILEFSGTSHGDHPSASDARRAISGTAGMYAPAVVLTEGRTDAEFLTTALKILYPHLVDLIRFLDYERKAEGGVSALVRMVNAFAAAGIVNRIIAAFDNDTAATDGLRALKSANLPAQIQVIRYPPIDLANDYPTLGPPTVNFPNGSVSLANVNGLAGSIELYLGRDVLTQADGSLYPVQWTAYKPGVGQYQGEVVNKNTIQQAFRVKCVLALHKPSSVQEQDWEGLRLILDEIRGAAISAFTQPRGTLALGSKSVS